MQQIESNETGRATCKDGEPVRTFIKAGENRRGPARLYLGTHTPYQLTFNQLHLNYSGGVVSIRILGTVGLCMSAGRYGQEPCI